MIKGSTNTVPHPPDVRWEPLALVQPRGPNPASVARGLFRLARALRFSLELLYLWKLWSGIMKTLIWYINSIGVNTFAPFILLKKMSKYITKRLTCTWSYFHKDQIFLKRPQKFDAISKLIWILLGRFHQIIVAFSN